MIRVEITAAAYEALARTLNPDSLIDPQPSPTGGFYLWLTRTILDLFSAARDPGESYSDVILRLAP
jgi:hypothetical protein